MGEVRKAKKALEDLTEAHPKHLASVISLVDLIDITTIEKDEKSREKYWRILTFDTPRTKQTRNACITASQQLASHLFNLVAFDDAVKALETTYSKPQMPYYIANYSRNAISVLTGDEKTKVKGVQLADKVIAFIKVQVPFLALRTSPISL